MTVWAPRQTGKSSVMLEATQKLKTEDQFDVAILSLQSAKEIAVRESVLDLFVAKLRAWFKRDFPAITEWKDLAALFTAAYFSRPVILILDEFDALQETFINTFANEFRNMYLERANEVNTPSGEKQCLLHGLALIGVRSVLGIENVTGSPFNVQRSIHIPNLTFEEVAGMFRWYEQESRQPVAPEVVNRLYAETRGQPGFVCWFGELLTEGYNEYRNDRTRPITLEDFERVYAAATHILPNNTLINIISKAKQAPYKEVVLELFETKEKVEFAFNEPHLNFLYMHGVIDREQASATKYYVKFACPFIQKGLFAYFSGELFRELGQLVEPFEPLADVLTPQGLSLPHLLKRYQRYLLKNREWLFKQAPRRVDLRIREAVYHFNLYMYLHRFLHAKGARVWPEFPTGNGKLDILISYQERLYGLEVKSFSDLTEYQKALVQAASYGKSLGLSEMILVFFIETIDEENRARYEAAYADHTTNVTVKPVFIETGM